MVSSPIKITTLELEEPVALSTTLNESLPDASTYQTANGDLEILPVLRPEDITYSDFFKEYLVGNRPCVFTEEVTRDWVATQEWTTSDDPPQINFKLLIQQFGGCEVSVTNCDKQGDNYDNLMCESTSLENYLKYLQDYRQSGYPDEMPCLYLKDWHITRGNLIGTHPMYQVPKFFGSDWLNETAPEQGDDFRFAYIGPKGSWTPFHADVYGSYSWSANIIGTKKWFLYPPGNENKFRKNGKLRFDLQNPGVRGKDFYEVIQRTGQVIFVPSGWHHIVWNLEDTISINHNWMNASNVGYIWANLKKALNAVQSELDDLKYDTEFSDLCQQLLKANHGMNYEGFRQILSVVSSNRCNKINHIDQYRFGDEHVKLDLSVISATLERMPC